MGHVHLNVADLAAAEAFYCGLLGFDLVTRYGESAGFVSAGGYHHHIGFNTWVGEGASPPPPNSLGLRYFTVVLPDVTGLESVLQRVHQAGLETEQTASGVLVRDPSQNGVLLTSRANT